MSHSKGLQLKTAQSIYRMHCFVPPAHKVISTIGESRMK